MTREIKKVLVIQTGSIGEFVLSLAAMKRIRQAHPHARITLLTTPPFEALAKSSPYFNEVLTEAIRDISENGYDNPVRLQEWLRRLRFAAMADLPTDAELQTRMKMAMEAVFKRNHFHG